MQIEMPGCDDMKASGDATAQDVTMLRFLHDETWIPEGRGWAENWLSRHSQGDDEAGSVYTEGFQGGGTW
jgi:hypothetical protein